MSEQLTFDDQTRTKIEIEETYRHEFRQQLEKNTKPKNFLGGFWNFLNSNLGLWLLSAIFITGIGALFTRYQNNRAEELKRKEVVERLDLEISYRFSQLQIAFDSMINDKDPKFPFLPGKSEKDVKEAIDTLSQPPKGKYPILYPEYDNYSTLALIAELRRHVSEREKEDLDQVIADLSGIYIDLDVSKVALNDVHGVATKIFKDLTLPRWRGTKFYFADCPFC